MNSDYPMKTLDQELQNRIDRLVNNPKLTSGNLISIPMRYMHHLYRSIFYGGIPEQELDDANPARPLTSRDTLLLVIEPPAEKGRERNWAILPLDGIENPDGIKDMQVHDVGFHLGNDHLLSYKPWSRVVLELEEQNETFISVSLCQTIKKRGEGEESRFTHSVQLLQDLATRIVETNEV